MRLLFAGLLVALSLGQAQVKPRKACDVVTHADAVMVLGPAAVVHERPGACAWDVPGQKIVFVVIIDSSPNVKQQIQIPRQTVPRNGGVVRDEPEVAPGAFSASIKSTQSIYLLKGNTGASITVTNDAGPLPDMLGKLRPVAKRIAGRL